MSKKVTILILLAVAAALSLLAGCERSAAPKVLATPTSGSTSSSGTGALATPQPTGLSLVQAWGTSTAIYVQTAVAAGVFTAVPSTPEANLTPVTTQSGLPGTGVPTNTLLPGTTPVSTPIPVAPTATPGRPASYTLHTGEFPYCLARRFNVDPGDLLSMNGLVDGQTLQPGLVLNIPSTGSFPGTRALHTHPAQYTVNVNDNIYSIACYFGDVDPSQIAAQNGIAVSTPLTTGMTLNIP